MCNSIGVAAGAACGGGVFFVGAKQGILPFVIIIPRPIQMIPGNAILSLIQLIFSALEISWGCAWQVSQLFWRPRPHVNEANLVVCNLSV